MNRKFIVLPKVKRRTLEDRDVWLWTQGKSKWLMNGKITVPCSTDKIMRVISDRFESTWRINVISDGVERTWTLTLKPKED